MQSILENSTELESFVWLVVDKFQSYLPT